MTEVIINGSQGKLQGFYKHQKDSKNNEIAYGITNYGTEDSLLLKGKDSKEIDEIMKVQSKLIINRSAFKTNNKNIQSIIKEIKSLIK